MSLDDERKEIEGAWVAISGVTFGYDRQAFEIAAPSVQLTIQSGDTFQASLGSPGTNLARTAGVAFFKIWTDGGAGSAEGNTIAETIMTMYRNKRLNNVKMGVPGLVPVQDEEPYTTHLVSVPYHRDEFNA